MPPEVLFGQFLGTCLGVPQRVLFECFLAFFGPKNAKKHSKSTLWGTPRQVPKIAQKALRGALSGPGPKSTPVNGGRDRKTKARFLKHDLPVQGLNFETFLTLRRRKKSTKIKFLGPETARWGGGLPREGVVAKNFVPALETLSSLGFRREESGMSREFCRDVPDPWRCSKSLCKKTSCAFFVPF